jgi:hypothetical protein
MGEEPGKQRAVESIDTADDKEEQESTGKKMMSYLLG